LRLHHYTDDQPCFCCGKDIDCEPPRGPRSWDPAQSAAAAHIDGNYGSEFDLPENEYIWILICDKCIKERAFRARLITHARDESEITGRKVVSAQPLHQYLRMPGAILNALGMEAESDDYQ